MNLDTFNACIEGYADRLFDYQLLSVHSGFWAAYFSNSKRPKSLNKILEKLVREKNKPTQKHVEDVDVEGFLEMERKFQERLRQLNKE